MPITMIDPTTFTATDESLAPFRIWGTVEVRILGKTRRVRAYHAEPGTLQARIRAFDIALGFLRGEQVWPGYIDLHVRDCEEHYDALAYRGVQKYKIGLLGFMADYGTPAP